MHLFISYRRADSEVITGRIYDRLVQAFGERAIFKDVDDIPIGVDFRKVLEKEVSDSDVILVILGKQWASITYEDGAKRLGDPNDFVRIEVENALKKTDALVVPVLVMGAGMPSATELPESLRDLTFRNAVPIRNDPDFNSDINRLIANLRAYQEAQRKKQPARIPVTTILAMVLVVAVVGLVLASSVLNNGTQGDITPTSLAQDFTATFTDEPSATPAPTNEPSPMPTDEPVLADLRAFAGRNVTIWGNNQSQLYALELLKSYLESFGISVNLVIFDDIATYRETLKVATVSGEMPDLFILDSNNLYEYYELALLSPIPVNADDFSFIARQLFSVGGNVYAMPLRMEGVVLARNTHLVPEAPSSWSDVREISERLVRDGTVTHGFNVVRDVYHTLPIVYSFGGYVYANEGELGYDITDVGFDNDGTRNALRWLRGMSDDGLAPGGEISTYINDEFISGQVAMMLMGTWMISTLDGSGVPYAISPIPEGESGLFGKSIVTGTGLAAYGFNNNSDLIEVLMQDYLAGAEFHQSFLDGYSELIIPAHDGLQVQNRVEEAKVALYYGEPYPREMIRFFEVAFESYNEIMLGVLDIDTGLETIANRLRNP